MNRPIKVTLFSVLILSLIWMVGCSNKQAFSNDEIKNIENGYNITISASSIASFTKVPKDIKTTLSKISPWLKTATQYEMPENSYSNDNSGDPQINIKASDGRIMIIYPARSTDVENKTQYVKDILTYSIDNHTKSGYFKSKELYDWLVNKKYEAEFDNWGY